MLDNQKLRGILDTIDGRGTRHGASIDQLKFLQREIKNRIKEMERLSALVNDPLSKEAILKRQE